MRRFVSSPRVLALVAASIVAGALVPTGTAGPARSNAAPTAITVTATEFKFAFSKPTVAAGSTVVFTVVNKGKIGHDFKIGTKKTPTIAPGKSATLTVTFAAKGRIAYLCTLPGHALGGMKGTFAVGVAPVVVPVTPKPAPTPTPTPTPTPATPAGPETLKGDPVAGAALFKVNECAGCHTLAAAGATGSIGPSLDARKPSQGTVKATVSAGAVAGGISMPSFSMSDTDLNNIAAYVYQSTHPGG